MFFDRILHRKKYDANAYLYRKIAITFFSISAVVAIVIFAISFSWATITLVPAVKPISDTIVVPFQEEPITLSGAFAGTLVQQELEGAGTFTPTAVSTVEGKATGTIAVVNTSSRAQPLRATTRFLSAENILFRSTAFVTVPAGGQIEVPVIADSAGEPGDLNKARFILPALWPDAQTQIYGVSFARGGGGTQTIRVVSSDDIIRAGAEVQKKLEDKFALLLDTEKAKVGAPAVASTLKSEVIEKTSDRSAGDQTKEFTVRLKVRFVAVLYDEQKLLSYLHDAMTQNLSTGYQLIDPLLEDTLGTIIALDSQTRSATVSFNVNAGRIRTDDLQPYHKKDLMGLAREDIITYFKGYNDITDVTVNFYPLWVKRAPLLLDHITIQIQKSR
jgi:hypothetical protein